MVMQLTPPEAWPFMEKKPSPGVEGAKPLAGWEGTDLQTSLDILHQETEIFKTICEMWQPLGGQHISRYGYEDENNLQVHFIGWKASADFCCQLVCCKCQQDMESRGYKKWAANTESKKARWKSKTSPRNGKTRLSTTPVACRVSWHCPETSCSV